MNKRRIDMLLPRALEVVLDTPEILDAAAAKRKSYRSQFSAFGAAVIMGDFRAVITFWSNDGDAGVKRGEMLSMMYRVAYEKICTAEKIRDMVLAADTGLLRQYREDMLHASVAIKQTLNAFDLRGKKTERSGKNDQSESVV